MSVSGLLFAEIKKKMSITSLNKDNFHKNVRIALPVWGMLITEIKKNMPIMQQW